MKLTGNVIRYGDNVDTDVIIPARYLNTSDPNELAAHCMEDLDKTFVERVRKGDIMVGGQNFGCGSSASMLRSPSGHPASPASSQRASRASFTAIPSTPACPSWNLTGRSKRATGSRSISKKGS
jgi:hypothetical protein